MKTRYALVPILALALMAGCKQNAHEDVVVDEPMTETVSPVADEPAAPVELVPVIQKAKPAVQAKAKPAATQSTQGKASAEAPLKGTIYVETDGAQGRVWGHVTMNGDKGTGTIHDWDENTWAVNVTRHGNELFAVDQNSRLYVFKLKQNKTQE
ncbi:MAG: hypothetical protein IJ524_08900 [Bacteroidales bacterium]|nr:hypothetical protein [Bacteroidales bacterium]